MEFDPKRLPIDALRVIGKAETGETRAQFQAEHDARRQRYGELASKLGRRYANSKLADFDCETDLAKDAVNRLSTYLGDVRARVGSGEGVVLYGPVGTGKDTLLSAMALQAVSDGLTLNWVNGEKIHQTMRDSFDGGSSEDRVLSPLTAPDVLYISDPIPPGGKLTDFQRSTLFRVIDVRYRELRPTWISVNASTRAELDDGLSSAVADRIIHSSLTVFCNWSSYRKSLKP